MRVGREIFRRGRRKRKRSGREDWALRPPMLDRTPRLDVEKVWAKTKGKGDTERKGNEKAGVTAGNWVWINFR